MGRLEDWTERQGECLVWTHYVNAKGYGHYRFKGKMVYVHRLAWSLANGPIPEGMQIDHICFNHACTEVKHLRLATVKQNDEHRQGATKKSKTGVRGVTIQGKKYRALLRHNGRRISLGTFETLKEAEAAAIAGRALYFTHA